MSPFKFRSQCLICFPTLEVLLPVVLVLISPNKLRSGSAELLHCMSEVDLPMFVVLSLDFELICYLAIDHLYTESKHIYSCNCDWYCQIVASIYTSTRNSRRCLFSLHFSHLIIFKHLHLCLSER